MSELTDLEICKRIAEIGGVEAHEFRGSIVLSDDYNEVVNSVKSGRYSPEQVAKLINGYAYNPLTDDALLNQLIFKYEISISFNFCLISMITNKQYEINFTDIPSLKRKCLLLIIEAHKDQS